MLKLVAFVALTDFSVAKLNCNVTKLMFVLSGSAIDLLFIPLV